ncbi:hypothetical protein [Azospirillum argentinense]|uniref:hypothetical protein n=1 Tax=Azospirillum argentinense TaxID=2970906 RepID=UPI00200028B2|nr:hypothetical protein [Azospirillum argentinense]
MLNHVQDLGFRSGEFTVEPLPDAETGRVLAVLAARHGTQTDATALVPDGREADLRGELAEAGPGLSALATAIRDRLETSHSGVLIRRAHLGRHDLDTRRRLLYALAVCMGAPTATDRIDRKWCGT